MRFRELIESSGQATVKLTDLYDEDELTDSHEMLSNYVKDDDLHRDFVVHTMTPEQAKTYKTPRDDMTVYEAFRHFAGRDQKRFVRERAAHYNHDRIIVTMFQTVVDGNHHLVAGILAKQPIRYINLADPPTVQEAIETGGVALTEAKRKMRPTTADLQAIRRIRHEVRCEEGEGGQCGFVAEGIMNQFGWPMVGGTYCNDVDEPICNDHVWNVLPDGAILDATADQMGLGHDIRIVEPSDPDHKKYRSGWDQDYNPGMPQYPELKGVKWSGKYDMDWANELRQQRGREWHVTDPKQYARYKRQVTAYRSGRANPKTPF